MPATSPTSRASLREWAQTVLLAGNFAWTTLCLGGARPETMVITSALNALLLALHLVGRSRGTESGRRFHPAGWWLLPFLGYAAVNAEWITPVPWLGWQDWLGWSQMILVFWVVLNDVRSRATRTFLWSGLTVVGVTTVALAAYQRFVKPDWLMMGRMQVEQFIGRASGSFGIPNSLAALLLLLILPMAVLTLRRRASAVQRVLAGYVTLVLAFGLLLTISRGAWLALALVLAMWPAFGAEGSRLRRAGMAALAALGVIATLAIISFSLPQVRERFEQLKDNAGEVTRPIMWRGAWQIFQEHRVWGGGAGSYNVLFEKFRPMNYQNEPVWAHNDYINTLSDYGLVGFVLFFGVAGTMAWRCTRDRPGVERDWLDDRKVFGAMVAGLVAFALQLLVDFHFKIPALAMAFAMVTALIVQRAWSDESAPGPAGPVRRIICVAGALAVLLAVGCWVRPFYQGEAIRYATRQSLNRLATRELSPPERRAILEKARAELTRAVELSPVNAEAWADLSYTTSLWSHLEPTRTAELGREAERTAARALAISEAVPEFWLRRGVALDMQGERSAAGQAFVRALKLAPASAGAWFYHAYHLSLNKNESGLALAAVEFCLRLDPGYREAQLLRQRLASGRRTP